MAQMDAAKAGNTVNLETLTEQISEILSFNVGEPMEVYEQADRLYLTKLVADTVESIAKELKAVYSDLNKKMAADMLELEMSSFKKSGSQFIFTNKFYANAEAERKPELLQALKDQGTGLIYETYNANSLRSYVKSEYEQNEDQLPGWLDGLVRVGLEPTVSIRKAR